MYDHWYSKVYNSSNIEFSINSMPLCILCDFFCNLSQTTTVVLYFRYKQDHPKWMVWTFDLMWVGKLYFTILLLLNIGHFNTIKMVRKMPPLVLMLSLPSFSKKYGPMMPSLSKPHQAVTRYERFGCCLTTSRFSKPHFVNLSTKMKMCFIRKDDFFLVKPTSLLSFLLSYLATRKLCK